MKTKDVFFNEFGRLRSGWRFAVFMLAFLLIGGILISIASAAMYSLSGPATLDQVVFLTVTDLVALVAAIVLGWLAGRLFEGLPFKAIGAAPTGRWFKHLTAGLMVGTVSLALAALVASAGGGLRFTLSGFDASSIIRSLALSAGVFLIAGAFEEAVFRGYVFQTFTRAGLGWFALLITSCFFGVVHLMNPNPGTISTINTMLAGLWLGVAYLKTRDLWFPLGVHMAWNWAQSAVFGVEVSGMTGLIPAPLMKEIDSGPAWLTGGDYGLEGGIACTIALLISTLVIYAGPWLKADEDLLALSSTESLEPRITVLGPSADP